MHTTPALQALDARRSVPSMELGEPGPDEALTLDIAEPLQTLADRCLAHVRGA